MSELKLLCWNVNGFRAVVKKGFWDFLDKEKPDIMCLQETKATPDQLKEEIKDTRGYTMYWAYPAERKGYSGTAVFTKEEPKSIKYDFGEKGIDIEGRMILAEYPAFTLMTIYFPNGGMGPERLKYKMDFYDIFLDYADGLVKQGKKLVICGDVNTAHKEIDLARPKDNVTKTGFLPEERAWIDKFVSHGYVDTFRHFHKEPNQYTYWDMKTGARYRNVGWRIDYFYVSENLLPAVKSSFIMREVMGSDHCPIGITLKLR
jgi:exodeoxyribonuclease III